MKKQKLNKLLLLIFFTIFSVLCPLSIVRTDVGISLEEKSIFAEPSEEKTDLQDKKDKENNNEEKIEKEDAAGTLYKYKEPEVEQTSVMSLIIRFVFIIALLLGGFYLFYHFVTKKTGFMSVGRGAVDILSAVPVGPNKYIQIVDIAGKIMVLGVTDSNINLITEVIDKDEKDRIRLESSKAMPISDGGFGKYFNESVSYVADLIRNTSSSFKKKTDSSTNNKRNTNKNSDPDFEDYFNNGKMSYLKNQRDRLKKLNGDGESDE